MKRIVALFLFLMLRILIFANKGTYDVTKYRQDVLNYAMAQVGKQYNQKLRMNPNIFDCSSFVDRASQAAGMNSVTGANTKNWANTTVSMRSGANPKKIPTDQIKAGDAILFNGHVVYALGTPNGCLVDVVHASNSQAYPRGGVKVSKSYNICTAHRGGYSVITAEQVLINNGYTPVNSEGQVVAPAAGVSVPSAPPKSPIDTSSTYDISWDEMQDEYIDMVLEGLEYIMEGILKLLSLLTALQLFTLVVPYMLGKSAENLLSGTIVLSAKFSLYAFLIKNYQNILNMMYEIFAGIGSLFLKEGNIESLDSLFSVSMKEAIKVMKLIDQYDVNIAKLLIPGTNLFDQTFYKVLILCVVMLMIGYFSVRVIFELMAVSIQYYLSFGLSYIFFSLGTNDVTKDYARRPVRTLFASGLRVTVAIMFASIIFGILEKASFGDVTLDTVRIETMFAFITSGLVMAFLMNKMGHVADSLNV